MSVTMSAPNKPSVSTRTEPHDDEDTLMEQISENFEKILVSPAGATPSDEPKTQSDKTLMSRLTMKPSSFLLKFPPVPAVKPADPPKTPPPPRTMTQPIDDWISQMEGISPEILKKTKQKTQSDEPILTSLSDFLLSDHANDRPELTQKIFEILLRFVQSVDENLNHFVTDLYPCLIWRQFCEESRRLTSTTTENPTGLSALLLAIYSLRTTDDAGVTKAPTFVIPSMKQSSVYHDMEEIPTKTNAYVDREVPQAGLRVPVQVFPVIERLNRFTRWRIFITMMKFLNQSVIDCSKSCHRSAVTVSQRLLRNSIFYKNPDVIQPEKPNSAKQRNVKRAEVVASALQALRPNFDKLSAQIDQLKDKIRRNPIVPLPFPPWHLDCAFLLELTQLLYTLMYQGYFDDCYPLVKDIQAESEYRLLPEVLLLANAVLNRAETTVGSSSYEEMLPRVDLELAEMLRKDMQRDIGVTVAGKTVQEIPNGDLSDPAYGELYHSKTTTEDVKKLLVTFKLYNPNKKT